MAQLDTNRPRPLKRKLHLVSRYFTKQYVNRSGYILVYMADRKKGVPTLGFGKVVLFHRWYYCFCHGLKSRDIKGDEIHHIGAKKDCRRHKLTRLSREQHKLIEMRKRGVHGHH